MTNEQEILWLAGLLEGEGYFGYPKGHHSARINLNMTDEDVVRRAAKIMRATVVTRVAREGNRKDQYLARVCGEKAASVMRQILPFMGQRRSAKIEEVLSQWERRVTHSESKFRYWAKKKRCQNTANLFVA